MRPYSIRRARLLVESLDERAMPAVQFGQPFTQLYGLESPHRVQPMARDTSFPVATELPGAHRLSGNPEVHDKVRDARETAGESTTDEGLEHHRNLPSAPTADPSRATEPALRAKGEGSFRRTGQPANDPDESGPAVAASRADFKVASPNTILTELVWLQPHAGDDSADLPRDGDTEEPHASMSQSRELPASHPGQFTLAIPVPVAGLIKFDPSLISEAVDQFLDQLSNLGGEFKTKDDIIDIVVWSAAGLLAGGAVGAVVNDSLGRYRAGPWPQHRIKPEFRGAPIS